MADALAVKASPLRGKWLWTTVFVVLGAALFVRLGFWQLARLDQRRASNAHLVARLSQPPVALLGQSIDPADLDLRRVIVRGSYDSGQEIVLRNRALNGTPGVHVITPLRISGTDAAVLIDRGWIPYEQAAPADRVAFSAPVGEVEIHGLAHISQQRLGRFSPVDPPLTADRPRLDEWFRVDIPRIQQQVSYTLLPIYVEEGVPDLTGNVSLMPSTSLPRPDIEIDLSEGPHLSYAIQWFSFAVILLAGYIALYLKRSRGAA